MARLEIALLGPPQVLVEGRQIEVDTRKAVALAAYLATTGRPHARDSLATLLWPDHDQRHARGALRRTLSALRGGVGDEALDVSRESIALRRGPGLDVDLDRFRSAIGADAGPEALERAVALYRDDFMAGFSLRDSAGFDDWQALEADALRRELAGALDRLVEALARQGRWAPAIRHARRRLALDPLQEAPHRQLIRLYALSGDRSAALLQYRTCVRTLTRELGVRPLPETTALYRAVNEGEFAPPPAASPDPPPPAAAPDPPPPAAPPALPLVGRAGERRAILAAHEGAGRDGHLVVVEGEAGIGKTRLAEDVVAEMRARGAAVLAARCHEDERGLPYSAAVELLRCLLRDGRAASDPAIADADLAEAARLVPELAAARSVPPATSPLDGPGAQARMLEAFAALLVAGGGPAPPVLLVDDLQWIDEASLDALGFLVRRLRGRPGLVLGTWRAEEVPADHRLRRLLAEAARERTATLVELGRLSADDLLTLVRSLGHRGGEELGRRLHRETGGLPFFVAEWLAGGEASEDVPAGVREFVRERAARAGDVARQLLTAAAVIGHPFDGEVLRAVSGRSDEEVVAGLEELAARGLVAELRDADGPAPAYDVGHDIVRSVVYRDASRARRRLLHGRAADALASAAGRGRRARMAAVIAAHLERAGREEEAAAEYAAAGEHAAALYANAEALAAFRSASALGHPQGARMHERCGDLETLLGDYAAAIASYEAAASELDAPALPRLEHKLGGLHHRRGDWALADSHFAAALGALGPDDPARARILADLSLTAHQRGDAAAAARLSREALARAQAGDDLDGLARAHNILGVIESAAGRAGAAREHLERSLAAAGKLGDAVARVAALNNLALLAGAEGRRDEALLLLEEALELCVRRGDRHREAALRNNTADLLHGAGRSEDAMAQLKQAVAIFAGVGGSEPDRSEIWKLARW